MYVRMLFQFFIEMHQSRSFKHFIRYFCNVEIIFVLLMSKFIIYQHNCINDEEQCYLVATCWVNETIVFIINNFETSQILIVTNSTQALINGHYIMISTKQLHSLVYFPQFCEIQKFADFTQKIEILVKITLKKPIWSKTFT